MQGASWPAGWYANPRGAGQRYWDGTQWTDHYQPDPPPAPPVQPPQRQRQPPAQQFQPVQQQPQTGNVVYVERRSNGLAVAALVCGIVGCMFGLGPAIAYVFPLALGAAAVVLGVLGRRRADAEPAVGRKTMATWGLSLGLVSIALGITGAVIVDDAVDDVEKSIEELEQIE